jgi:hypothetical protein
LLALFVTVGAALAAILLLAFLGFYILRKRLVPAISPGRNLQPSGARPWQLVRMASMHGNTNWRGDPMPPSLFSSQPSHSPQSPTPLSSFPGPMPQAGGWSNQGPSMPQSGNWANQGQSMPQSTPYPTSQPRGWSDQTWVMSQEFAPDAAVARSLTGPDVFIAPLPVLPVLPETPGDIPVHIQPSPPDTDTGDIAPSAPWFLQNAIWNAPSGFDQLDKSSLDETHFRRNSLLPITQPLPDEPLSDPP